MSREQGPHEVGMRPAAIAAGHRQSEIQVCPNTTEASA